LCETLFSVFQSDPGSELGCKYDKQAWFHKRVILMQLSKVQPYELKPN